MATKPNDIETWNIQLELVIIAWPKDIQSSSRMLKVLAKGQQWQCRKVKEAIYVKLRAPQMNQDQGYQLALIYNQLIPPVSR